MQLELPFMKTMPYQESPTQQANRAAFIKWLRTADAAMEDAGLAPLKTPNTLRFGEIPAKGERLYACMCGQCTWCKGGK